MKCGNSGEAATWFSECARMRARPVGPAESSALHDFARSGPTKEAHRRALYRSSGLQHSVAGQGHGRFLPVTLPRGASDQRKRAEAGAHRSPTPRGTHQGRGWGTHQGRDQGTLGGPIRGGPGGPRNHCAAARMAARNCPLGIARLGWSEGLNRPRRGRDPAPGRVRPMPSPGGKYHPARQTPASSSLLLAAGAVAGDGQAATGGCGGSSLTPGRAGWSR